MKTFVAGFAALLMTTGIAQAGGLDRSGQKIAPLFEKGNYFEFSFGRVMPSVDGTDTTQTPFNPTADAPIGGVASDFNVVGSALKYQFNDAVSFAIIVDQPYGSDVTYPGDQATTALGGTQAIVDSVAVTALGRYKFNDNFSAHGGVRYQKIEADVTLGGLAYGPLNGYNGKFESDGEVGYVIGGAYERPEIALRVALTYNSKITHNLNTVESVNGFVVNPGSDTEIVTPESLNLDFQTGVAKDTLVFGAIRYARYEDTIVAPDFFGARAGSLTDIENSTDYEIGVGRRFSDQWSGSVTVGYASSGDDLVSPLAPTNGSKFISLGARYAVNDALAISGGVRYTKLGDALPETGTPDTARADFEDNSVVSVGLKIGYNF